MVSVRVTGAATFCPGQDACLEWEPEASGIAVAPLLALVQQTVVRAEAFKDGRFVMAFSDGSQLRVPPDPAYEPWTLATGQGKLGVISMPGGHLGIMFPQDT